MRKIIGILAITAVALGMFLAVNTVSPENNSELSLSSLTSLTTADASCTDGAYYKQYERVEGTCYDGEGDSYTCYSYQLVSSPRANNGSCEDGVNCWSGEGSVYDCYTR